MKIRQCGYGDALRYLAQKYNIEIKEAELSDDELRRRQERDAMYAAVDAAAGFYRCERTSPEGLKALEAIAGVRRLPAGLLDRCGIGYAPASGHALQQALASRGFSVEALTAAGLVTSESGDSLSGVVTVAVTNHYGRVVGFEAFNPDGSAATTEMPDTAIWHRNDAIAGLYGARGAIARTGQCIVLPDALQLLWTGRCGIENAVALTSPGWSDVRIKTLSRMAGDVTLLLPQGSAAIFARLRDAVALMKAGIHVKVVSLPGHERLDRFVDTHSTAGVTDALERGAVDMVIYRISALRRARRHSEAWRTLFDDLIYTIGCVPEPLMREAYINELSDATSLPAAHLTRLTNS